MCRLLTGSEERFIASGEDAMEPSGWHCAHASAGYRQAAILG